MRIVPVLTAALVLLLSYMFVMERETLYSWAGVEAPAREPVENAGQAGSDPEVDMPVSDSEDLFAVVIETVQETDLENGIVLRGRTQAFRQVEVRSETTGQVVSEPRRRGSMVSEGDLLCELDPGTRAASVAEAEARLAEAQINFTTTERLSEGGYAAQTRLASTEAGLRAAQAGVEAARAELGRLQIFAPFEGLLEANTAETGSLLSAGGLCATVIQLDPILLVGFAAEDQIGRLQVGAPAGARLSSGEDVVGQVTFLARAGDSATRTFRVEVSVPNPDLAIRDGLSADLLVQARATRGHLVPGSALTLDNDGAIGLRLVDDQDVTFFRPVRVLRDTPDGFWVSGLPETARVIVVGQEYVTDDVHVRVVERSGMSVAAEDGEGPAGDEGAAGDGASMDAPTETPSEAPTEPPSENEGE